MSKSLLILTGHSQGLGRALLDWYLEQKNFEIIGISRTLLEIQSPRLKELSLDLSDMDSLEDNLDLIFPTAAYRQIILINNAGSIGEIKPVGRLDSKQLRMVFNLNMLAPALLTNSFVKRYQDSDAKRVVCNISSGAADKPMEGWSEYCSSKASLAMFTMVCQAENENSGVRFYSLAPGIIDTEMQSKIRESSPEDFPAIERFKTYKSEGKLSSGADVAQKIGYLLANPDKFDAVKQDVRDLDMP